MIHDKIQNCSIDKTRIMMIEISRQNERTPKEVFVNSTLLDVVSVADVKQCVEDSLVRLGICQVTNSMSDHKCRGG